MADASIEISDFQFRALRRIRLFANPGDALFSAALCPSWVTASSKYAIVVCATGHNQLVSLRSTDIHQLTTNKTNINKEVTDLPMKVTNLNFQQDARLVALGCSCSGRVLSVLMATASGAFVHLYDICAFSVDIKEQRGPVYSLRVSSDANAKPCCLEWNPQLDDVFALAASDGTMSCYSFNIEESSSITLLGTVKQNDVVTCISWSPKGKQLVAGDVSGQVRQYKPEMTLVRMITAPANTPLLAGADTALRCVGISWLATTEFLIAYSPQTGQEVDVALLQVKKDSPPQWKHFDDINYCADRSCFDQQIKFTQLLPWKLVLCSSLRSSEVVVIGKADNEWKVWTLDDSGRIEMPLDETHRESFPIGVSIDTSFVLPVKIGDEDDAKPCPTILVLASGGILLAFSALSSRVDHQNINNPPTSLPAKIYGTVGAKISESENAQSAETKNLSSISSPDISDQNTSVSSATNSLSSFSYSGIKSVPEQTLKQPQTQEKAPKDWAEKPVAPVNSVRSSEHKSFDMQKEQSLVKLREGFRKKLLVFDEQFFEMRERNDWLQDLKSNTVKHLKGNRDINLDDEILEMEKHRAVVASWIDRLEEKVKEALCKVKEQLEVLDSTNWEQYQNSRVLDFNSMYRLNKLEEALTKLEQKIVNIEDSVSEIPSRNSEYSRSNLNLSVDEERKIATTAKNICKKMVSRRITLCELQQRITNLSARSKSLKLGESLFSTSLGLRSFAKSPISRKSHRKELALATKVDDVLQRRGLLEYLTKRGPVKHTKAKVITFDVRPPDADEKSLNSTIANMENRLIEAALTPMKTITKLVMDVGTQSPDYMSAKDSTNLIGTRTTANKTAQDVIVNKLQNVAVNEENKPQSNKLHSVNEKAFHFIQPQKVINQMVVPSNTATEAFSLKNLDAAATTASTVSSSDAPATVSVPTFKDVSSKDLQEKNVQDSVQVTSSGIIFSFKNPAAVTGSEIINIPQGIVCSNSSTPDKSNNNAEVTQETSSSLLKSNENTIRYKGLLKPSDSKTATLSTIAPISRTMSITKAKNVEESEEASVTSIQSSEAITISSSTGTTAAETNVSFSFKLPTVEKQQPTASTIDSGLTSSNVPEPLIDADAMGDDGMMEAEGTGSSVPTNLFSSLSFGSAMSNSNASPGVFGSGIKFGTPSTQLQKSSLFGSAVAATGDKGSSVFGGGSSSTPSTGGIFSRAQQPSAASPSSFTFSSALSNPQNSSLFGAKSTTGGATFGGAPTFGSKPVFGTPSPLVAAFGQQRTQQTPPASTGFSAFAKSGAVGFGSLAAGQQQSSGSVFGGSGFGSLSQQPQKSSVFGGGMSSSKTNSSFSTWR